MRLFLSGRIVCSRVSLIAGFRGGEGEGSVTTTRDALSMFNGTGFSDSMIHGKPLTG